MRWYGRLATGCVVARVPDAIVLVAICAYDEAAGVDSGRAHALAFRWARADDLIKAQASRGPRACRAISPPRA